MLLNEEMRLQISIYRMYIMLFCKKRGNTYIAYTYISLEDNINSFHQREIGWLGDKRVWERESSLRAFSYLLNVSLWMFSYSVNVLPI